MKRTILGGVLFLAPLAVVAIVLGKAFQLSLAVAAPIDGVVPIDSLVGVATINIVAILLILLICYVAGSLAQRAFWSGRFETLDGLLIEFIPSYAVFKGVLGSASSEDALSTLLKPVMVRFDDYDQLAFEIETDDERSVVFLPGSPSAWAGSTVVVEIDRVTYIDMPTIEATRLLRTFGRGVLAARGRLKSVENEPAIEVNPATP